MGRIIEVARSGNRGSEEVVSTKYKTGESIVKGSLVVKDANGELTLCGADPAAVYGVALEAAGSKPGYDAANSPLVVTGRVQEISVAKANANTVFSMRGSSDPAVSNEGKSYGVTNSSGEWILDLTDTTNTIFAVLEVDVTNKIFYGKFIPAKIQA